MSQKKHVRITKWTFNSKSAKKTYLVKLSLRLIGKIEYSKQNLFHLKTFVKYIGCIPSTVLRFAFYRQ